MGVSYKKLFKILIDRNMKKKDLQKLAELSPSTMAKLSKDEYVRMEVILHTCEYRKIPPRNVQGINENQQQLRYRKLC